jgi:hypothetical protein
MPLRSLADLFGPKYGPFLCAFLVLFGLALVYSFPFLLLDRYYIDDLGRSIHGYARWEKAGRPLATWMTGLLNLQRPWDPRPHLIDISPLPQLLALASLAAAAALLFLKLFPEKDRDISAIIVVFPLIGSPYLIENLSFKFDSFSMALALSLSVIAAFKIRGNIADIFIGSLLIVAALSLYQAAVNAFIGTTGLLLLSRYFEEDRRDTPSLANNALKFATASVIYKVLILHNFFVPNRYASLHSELISFHWGNAHVLFNNIKDINQVIFEFFSQAPILTISALISSGALMCYILYHSDAGWNRIFISRVLTVLGGVFLVISSIYGASIFLKVPVIVPRTMMGFTIVLVFLFYCYRQTFCRLHPLLKIGFALPLLYMFVISYGYAAATRQQGIYDRFLVSSFLSDLEEVGFSPENYLVFDGRQPISPVLKNSSRLKIIGRLVPVHIAGQRFWGYKYIRHFDFEFRQIASNKVSADLLRGFCSKDPVVETQHYRIYRSLYEEEDVFLIAFEGGKCT